MSVEIKLNNLMDGNGFHLFRSKCIYAWKRRARWLYVGKSTNGLTRVLGNHNVLNVVEPVLANR